MLEPEGAEELDDSAILRWAGHLVEPHHLVRNVRRATLEGEGAAIIHAKLAEMWAGRQGPRARRMEAITGWNPVLRSSQIGSRMQ